MQYVKVEPSRLLMTNIFVQSLISRLKNNTKRGGGGWWICTKFNS